MPLYVPGNTVSAHVLEGDRYSAGMVVNGLGTMPLKTYGNGDGDGGNHFLAKEVSAQAGVLYARPVAISDPITAFGGDIWIQMSDPDFIASNIRTGVSLFGLTGSLVDRPYASGTVSASGTLAVTDSAGNGHTYTLITVTGLSFTPDYVVCTPVVNPVNVVYALSAKARSFIAQMSLSWAPDYFWLGNNTGLYASAGTFRLAANDTVGKAYNWQAWGAQY